MKNKIAKASLLLATLLFAIPSLSAKAFTSTELEEMTKSTFDDITVYETAYVFGKHMYMNVITMADMVEAANTLGGATNAQLLYKNGANEWTNAITNESVDVSDITFEITKVVVANPSIADNILDNDDDAEKVESLGKTSVVFEESKIVTQITNIRSVTSTSLDSKYLTDANNYNINNLNVEYDEEEAKLVLTEETPLMTYDNGYDTEKWIGLLVETNKAIDTDNVSLVFKDFYNREIGDEVYYHYNIDTIDITDASRHGATTNEFVIWIKGYNKDIEGTILVVENDPVTHENYVQEVQISYDAVDAQSLPYALGDVEAELVVNTDELDASEFLIDDTYYVIFYSNTLEDFESDEISLFVDGDLSSYSLESNVIIPVFNGLTVSAGLPVDLTADSVNNSKHKWNQEAFSLDVEESEEEGIDYQVTITKNKEFIAYNNGYKKAEWYSLILDTDLMADEMITENYGINTIDYEESEVLRHSGYDEAGTAFVMWLQADQTERVVTFKNAYNNDKAIKVKFVVVDEVPELTFNAKNAAAVDIYNVDTNGVNTKFKANMNNLEDVVVDYNETTHNATVTLQAKDILVPFTYQNTSRRWMALVVDLGVDPEKLVTTGTNTYNISQSDIALASVLDENASETAFVMWIYPANFDGKTYKFVYQDTLDVIELTFDINQVTLLDTDLTNPTVETDGVKYISEGSKFRINTDVTEFTATEDGITYYYSYDGNSWSYKQTLKLESAVALSSSKPGLSDDLKYNQDSIVSVLFDDSNVTTVFNRVIGQANYSSSDNYWYAVTIDLGLDSSKVVADSSYTIQDADRNGNEITIWLKAEETNNASGKTITFKNTDDLSIVKTITFRSGRFSTINDLHLVSAGNISTTNLTSDPYYDNIVNNNEGLSTSVKEGKVEIEYDKPFTSYNNGHGNNKWFAVLVDLGVNPTGMTVSNGYTINPEDITTASNLGATSNTAFVMWLRVENFIDNELTYTFTNGLETNKYNTLSVTFKLVDAIEDLELKSVKLTDANTDVGVYSAVHKVNQENLTVTRDGNDFTFAKSEDNELATYDNGNGSHEWYAVLVDFGVDTKYITATAGYTIEEIDKNADEVVRHGGTESTEFILWLKADESDRTITFKNTYNEETVDVNISSAVN